MGPVTAARGAPHLPPGAAGRPVALVWIDSREAVVVHWTDSEAHLDRFESDVPAHHRSTGHVGHDPTIRHGGGGRAQTADEPRRLEHLVRFMSTIEAHILAGDDLVLIGPGTVHEHLAVRLRERDRRYGIKRTISCETAPRMTDRQLVARLRRAMGDEARRRTVGAYRWIWPEPPESAPDAPARSIGQRRTKGLT